MAGGLGGSLVWWVVLGGGQSIGSLYVAVSCTRGVLPPLGEGVFFFGFNSLALAELAFCPKKIKKLKKIQMESNSSYTYALIALELYINR